MTDEMNLKEDKSVRNILFTVGLVASAAVTATGVIGMNDAKAKSVEIASGGDGVPDICTKGTMVERAKAGQCWRDEQKNVWWVGCFGKFANSKKCGGK